jgi:hypothetical protein
MGLKFTKSVSRLGQIALSYVNKQHFLLGSKRRLTDAENLFVYQAKRHSRPADDGRINLSPEKTIEPTGFRAAMPLRLAWSISRAGLPCIERREMSPSWLCGLCPQRYT